MKKILLILTCFFFTVPALSASEWGRTGHYITGEIAWQYLTDQTKAEVERVLGDVSLSVATVWMDQVRPRDEYRHTADWHWVTIPYGMSYEEAEKNPNGDIIQALERKIAAIKEGGLSESEERDHLRMIIHMVGDIHQPLHVGTGKDRGGNDVRVEWMGDRSNLHRVWDTNMIESYGYEVVDIARGIDRAPQELIEKWQTATVRGWALESVSYRDAVYNIPEDGKLDWEYRNRNFHIVEKRLLQAGVRMAAVLNAIYGPE